MTRLVPQASNSELERTQHRNVFSRGFLFMCLEVKRALSAAFWRMEEAGSPQEGSSPPHPTLQPTSPTSPTFEEKKGKKPVEIPRPVLDWYPNFPLTCFFTPPSTPHRGSPKGLFLLRSPYLFYHRFDLSPHHKISGCLGNCNQPEMGRSQKETFTRNTKSFVNLSAYGHEIQIPSAG